MSVNSKRACGDTANSRSHTARTAAAPSTRVPSGAGRVFSNTQSAVIIAMMPSTSWRLNASLKRWTIDIVSGGAIGMAAQSTPAGAAPASIEPRTP